MIDVHALPLIIGINRLITQSISNQSISETVSPSDRQRDTDRQLGKQTLVIQNLCVKFIPN